VGAMPASAITLIPRNLPVRLHAAIDPAPSHF